MKEQMSIFEKCAAVTAALPKADAVAREAVLSPDGVYRYGLTRAWEADLRARPAVFVMLNPSTADATLDDPTIRRCIGFAKRLGCGALDVVNLYALRATDPGELATAADPVGPDNTDYIRRAARYARDLGGVIIAAWGASGPKGWEKRAAVVLAELTTIGDVYCLGRTSGGAPKHPLYLKADAPLELLAEGPSREPIPLSSPDGALFGFACRHCLKPEVSGGSLRGERRAPGADDIEHARDTAMSCCVCHTCGKAEIGIILDCKACCAKEAETRRAQEAVWKKASESAATAFAYRLTALLTTWKADAPAPSPLTITCSRDGLGFFAFPLDHNEVPEEVSARMDCATWFEENQAAPFGRGATPEAALADLRERARAVKAETKQEGM